MYTEVNLVDQLV